MTHKNHIIKKAYFRRYGVLPLVMTVLLSFLSTPIISGAHVSQMYSAVQIGQYGGDGNPVAEAGGPYEGWINIPVQFDGSGSHVGGATVPSQQQSVYTTSISAYQSTPIAVGNNIGALQVPSNMIPIASSGETTTNDDALTTPPTNPETSIIPPSSPEQTGTEKKPEESMPPVTTAQEGSGSLISSSNGEQPSTTPPPEGPTASSTSPESSPKNPSGGTTSISSPEVTTPTSSSPKPSPVIEIISEEEGAQSSGGGYQGLQFRWDFDSDGNYDTEWLDVPTITHTYLQPEEYQVTLMVKDAAGKTDTDTAQVVIGISPIGDTEPPSKVTGLIVTDAKEGKLSLNWEAATDNVEIDHYNIYRDTHLIGTTSLLTYLDVELTNDVFYTYQVSAVDTSSNEGQPSDPKDGCSTGMNLPPIATITNGPYFGWVGEPVQFDGSSSYDLDGTIVSYQWSFGDGTYGSGRIVTHSYEDVDVYTATLTVTDDMDGKDDAQVTVTVVEAHKPPIADAGGPYFGYADEPIVFNGSKSHDTDGTIVSYLWKFGDGTNSTGVSPIHNYSDNGTFIVTLTVKDNDGGVNSNTTYAVIIAENRAPSAPKIQMTKTETGEYKFTFIATDPDGDDITYSIDWNDGKTFTTPAFPSDTMITASHRWMEAGTYVVKVTATDGKAVSEIATQTVTVDSSASEDPSLDAAASSTGFFDLRYTVMIGIMAAFGVVLVFKKKKRT